MENNILKKNIEALKETQKYLVDLLDEIDFKDKYILSKNKNGEDIIELKNSKKRLISKYNPSRDAKKALEDLKYEYNSGLYVVMGMELGYKLRELLKNHWNKMVIVVIERDLELLKINLMNYDYSEVLKTKTLFFSVGEFEDDNYIGRLQSVLYKCLHSTTILYSTKPTSNIDEDIIFFRKNAEFINKTKEVYSFKLGNSPDDTLIGLRNRFENIVKFIEKPGVNQIKEKFPKIYKDKPAVIVASGPSLEKNIEYLKEYQDKILILACDGSYKRLKMEGIKAHAIGSIERIIKTYEVFYKGEEENFDEDLMMLSPCVVRSEIMNIFKDRFISFYKHDMHGGIFESIDKKGAFFCGASVAHSLFGFAVKMGCDPIVLIGQDLAYSKDGVSHAKGVSVIEYKEEKDYELYLKDYEGNELGSTNVWKMFKEIYEEAIRQVKAEVIDATEGGAYIEGTKVKTLKETLKEYCNEDIKPLYEIYKELDYKNENSKDTKKNLINFILEKYDFLLDMNKKINSYTKDLKKALNLLNKHLTSKQLDWIFDVVFGVDEEIIKAIMKDNYTHLVVAYLISNAARAISSLGAKEYDKDILIKNINIQKMLLKELSIYIRKMLRVTYIGLNDVVKEIDLDELNIEINFSKMERDIDFILNDKKYTLPII
ncbi:6-hydroxymethylpterin diphosphokinase MptE-like protein [Peptostreptococcaceae bacterium AGR-M142]